MSVDRGVMVSKQGTQVVYVLRYGFRKRGVDVQVRAQVCWQYDGRDGRRSLSADVNLKW